MAGIPLLTLCIQDNLCFARQVTQLRFVYTILMLHIDYRLSSSKSSSNTVFFKGPQNLLLLLSLLKSDASEWLPITGAAREEQAPDLYWTSHVFTLFFPIFKTHPKNPKQNKKPSCPLHGLFFFPLTQISWRSTGSFCLSNPGRLLYAGYELVRLLVKQPWASRNSVTRDSSKQNFHWWVLKGNWERN